MFNKVKETPNTVEQAAIQTMTNLVQQHQFTFSENFDANVSAAKNQANPLRRPHTQVWNSLWETGFHISTSLAENVINGDQINSTIYAVLSQVRAFEFETDTSAAARADIYKLLMYAEGCYDSYHTLQAGDLWKEMTTIDDMNTVVMMWLLTLEKQVRLGDRRTFHNKKIWKCQIFNPFFFNQRGRVAIICLKLAHPAYYKRWYLVLVVFASATSIWS